MDHKQVQEAIDRMAVKRKAAKDSSINSSVDVIVLDNDSVISEDEDSNPLVISIPSPSQVSPACEIFCELKSKKNASQLLF